MAQELNLDERENVMNILQDKLLSVKKNVLGQEYDDI